MGSRPEALDRRLPDREAAVALPPPREVPVLTLVRGPQDVPPPPDPGTEEAEWVRRIQGGDPDAFDLAFERFYPGLCSFVLTYVGSPQVAEDLVQDVFVDLWQRRAELDPATLLRAFLYRAAKNQALKHLRHRRVTERSRGRVVVALHPAPATPEERFSYEALASLLRQCIDDLPERCREVFLLSRSSGLSYAQIADLLEISVKTVETQMGRALRAIRAAVDRSS